MAHEHLATYLNDHLAGSTAGLELLEHLERTYPDSAAGRSAAGLRADIAADREELRGLMGRLNVTASATRQAAGWLAEKLARVKLRVDDPAGGPLHLFEGLEALSLGVEGKRLLWRALAASGATPPPTMGYERLQERAEEQRRRVEELRLTAARSALSA